MVSGGGRLSDMNILLYAPLFSGTQVKQLRQ